ncbi:MAG TPA: class I SAM-dependent methyltransferase [Acetobacteraceae bacterium]|nr:class I SAM-dependent methyltransferase [Acetobacteraceae bacterium]
MSETLPAREVMPFHQGADYLGCLSALHRALAPARYLEIGVWLGESLARAACASIAIDPEFQLGTGVLGSKPECHFFQTTSNDFFARHDPRTILGGPIDLAFLDGLHQFDALLRDFANTERFCRPESVIVLHDCLPIDPLITNRRQDEHLRKDAVVPGWWAGDVWKMLVILKRLRPDLAIIALDAPPTGLVLVSRLDPANRVLSERSVTIIEEMMPVELKSFGTTRLFDLAAPRSTALLDDAAALKAALS